MATNNARKLLEWSLEEIWKQIRQNLESQVTYELFTHIAQNELRWLVCSEESYQDFVSLLAIELIENISSRSSAGLLSKDDVRKAAGRARYSIRKSLENHLSDIDKEFEGGSQKEPTPEEEVIARDLRVWIQSALSFDDCLMLNLLIDGASNQDLEDAFKIEGAAVKVRKHRLRKRIKQYLERKKSL